MEILEEQKRIYETQQQTRQMNITKQDNESFKQYDMLHERMIQNVYN